MARRGDGLYLRGSVWYLDCRIAGQRHVTKLGKGINRTVAGELASVKRSAILRGEHGIGKKKKDLSFTRLERNLNNGPRPPKQAILRRNTKGVYAY